MKRLGHLLALMTVATLLLAACGGAGTAAPATSAPATSAPATQPPAATATTGAAPEATATTAAAPEATATTAATGGSEITVVLSSDPATLDPQISEDFNERVVTDSVYETLLWRDADMNIIPKLATEYTQVDDTTWQFKLRDGVKFHNGDPFNADAVVFSIQRIIDPETKSDQVSNVGTVTGAEKVDDLTVNIITSGPDPIMPARMTMVKIVDPAYVQADPAKFAEAPVGTGPYKFVKWDHGVEVVIEANADYWGDKPSIQTVHLRPIEEESTRLAALSAGEVDLVFGLLPEQMDQAPVGLHTPGLEFPMILLYNGEDSVIKDVRLRQAMNYAVDKEAIAEQIYGGFAVPADGQILTPGHFGYNPEVQAYPYDPEKAKQLIQESGYKGEEILLQSEAGRWLKDKELVEVVAGQLTEVGLNVKINISEFSNYLSILFDKEHRAPMIFVSHDNSLLDADRTLSAYYSCEGTAPSYCNPDVTKMINEARTEKDETKRLDLYHQIIQTAHDEGAHLYLLNTENTYGVSTRLDFTPRRDARLLFAEMSLK
jgi:peptide/nickel transport system substrate-binding protein